MAETDQEKSEQPTSKRREDFRKEGNVAQSKEVNTALLLSVSLLLWFFYAPVFVRNLQNLLGTVWTMSGNYEINPSSVMVLVGSLMQTMTLLLAPPLLLAMVVAFAASYMQIGWLFTLKPLEPKLDKLDPIKGLKRLVSVRALVELAKSLAKVSLIGYVAYLTVAREYENALYLIDMDVVETLLFVGRVTFWIMLKTCAILLVLAVLDLSYSRWEMEKKMKMTKQEVKEEHKQTEGDPHIKSRIRSLQLSAARRRMMADVPKADVVITNPTHLSVALSYVRGEMDAPKVVAKGADRVALKIREIATEHRVPLVENVPVARALYEVEIGQQIPEEMFRAVAEILAHVYSLKGQRA